MICITRIYNALAKICHSLFRQLAFDCKVLGLTFLLGSLLQSCSTDTIKTATPVSNSISVYTILRLLSTSSSVCSTSFQCSSSCSILM